MIDKTPQEMMADVNKARRYMEATAEGTMIFAKMMRVCYESLIDSGFSESQALEITKARGPFLIGGNQNSSGD